MRLTKMRLYLSPLALAVLTACGGGGSGDSDTPDSPPTPPQACRETGEYACKTGATEPLYAFQWALNYAGSYFKAFPQTFSGGLDLNVEPVHSQGIKGQGVNVLVLDSGVDLHNEDLSPNADFSMSWNFRTEQHDPFPNTEDHPDDAPHGTLVAGIIAAAQNGKGVMGIAPRVKLGGANFLEAHPDQTFAAFGGASWSSKAHVINASFGLDWLAQPYGSALESAMIPALRGLKHLRDGKGALYVKAAGNSFNPHLCGTGAGYYDCTNPANDPVTLEPNVIVTAAMDTLGHASDYSSAGSVIWVSGLAGEYGGYGSYGEGGGPNGQDGPTIFSTDIRGCHQGYSRRGERTPFLRGETSRDGQPDNPNCDYAYMNGTSSAAPTITGVTALILSANPDLSWRDVRDILRLSARKVDADYIHRIPYRGDKPYGALMDLRTDLPINQLGAAADIHDGAVAVPMDLGWQRNAAGNEHANWYGFGVPDAHKAVALALEYQQDPGRSRPADVSIAPFAEVARWQLQDQASPPPGGLPPTRTGAFPYQRITSIGKLSVGEQVVDQFQVRMSGRGVCLGSLGVAVKSPSGTVSLLKLPNDHFKSQGMRNFQDYALGSVAFYGEQAQGEWEIFTIAGNPETTVLYWDNASGTYKPSAACPTTGSDGAPLDYSLNLQARIIAQ